MLLRLRLWPLCDCGRPPPNKQYQTIRARNGTFIAIVRFNYKWNTFSQSPCWSLHFRIGFGCRCRNDSNDQRITQRETDTAIQNGTRTRRHKVFNASIMTQRIRSLPECLLYVRQQEQCYFPVGMVVCMCALLLVPRKVVLFQFLSQVTGYPIDVFTLGVIKLSLFCVGLLSWHELLARM